MKIKIPSNYSNEFETIEVKNNTRNGAFSKCYFTTDGLTVYLFTRTIEKESDLSKEAVSLFCNTDNPYIPNIEKIGDYDYGDSDYGMIFKSPFYRKFNRQNASEESYQEYIQLRKAYKKIWDNIDLSLSGYEISSLIIEELRDKVSGELIEALESLNNACSAYGDNYYMEFVIRNLKVNESGHLILADVMFNGRAKRNFKRQS